MSVLKTIYLLYFLSHIPITILVDVQAIFPSEWFPKAAVEARDWYIKDFGDYLFGEAPAWYKAFIYCEAFLQLPFFFVALVGILLNAKWIRIPLIIYGSHVVTTVIAIFYEIFNSGRLTEEQLPRLAAIYAPYLFVPLLLVLHCSLSENPFGGKAAVPSNKDKKNK